MTQQFFIVTKVLTTICSLAIFATGLFFVFFSTSAILDETGNEEPFTSILFVPGIFLFFIGSALIFSLFRLKKTHAKYLHLLVTIASVFLAFVCINYFNV